eukprot:GGOE01018833.1.p1 GENE.GGOE01018833.1~~GGOE01018833.1.p1  ORF type:complete len:1078 (-),score=256.43 GGOE01018833.1:291-3266(-)
MLPSVRWRATATARKPLTTILRQFVKEAFPERRWRQITRPIRNLPAHEAFALNQQLLRECVEDLELESPSGLVVHSKLDALYNLWEVTPKGGEFPTVEAERLFSTLEDGAKYFTEYYCARVTEDLWRLCNLDPMLHRVLMEPCGQQLMQAIGRRATQPDILPLFDTSSTVVMISHFGLLNSSCPMMVQALGDHLAQMDFLVDLEPPEVAATVKGLALVGETHPLLLDSLAYRVCRGSLQWFPLLSQLKRDDILTIIRGYGALKHRNEDLMLALGRMLLQSGMRDELSFDEVADIAVSFGRLRVYEEGVMTLAATRTMAELPDMEPQSLGKVARAFARLGILDEDLMGGIAERAIQEPVMRALDPTTTADLLWSFARLGVQHTTLVTALVHHLTSAGFSSRCSEEVVHDVAVALTDGALLSLLPPSDVLNVLEAFAKVRLPGDKLVAGAVREVVQRRLVSGLDADSVARLAGACSSARIWEPELVDQMFNRILVGGFFQTCSPAQAAEFAQFFAVVEVRRPEVLRALADCIRRDSFLGSVNGHSLAQLTTAVKQLNLDAGEVLHSLAQPAATASHLQQCSPEDLVALAEAFAAVGVNGSRVLEAIAQCAISARSLASFSASQMVQLSSAYAVVEHHHVRLLDAIGEQLGGHGRIQELDLTNTLRLLSSCAALHYRDASLLQALVSRLEVLGGPTVLSDAPLAAAVGQLAAVRMRSQSFLSMVEQVVVGEGKRTLEPAHQVTIAWACASLSFSTDALTAHLLHSATDRRFIAALDTRQVNQLLWALVVFNSLDDRGLEGLLAAVLQVDTSPGSASLCPLPVCKSQDDCARLHQVLLHVRLNAQRLPHSSQHLANAEAALARCATSFAIVNWRAESPLQHQVLETVRGLTSEGQERALLQDTGGYSADVLFSADRLVLEVLDEDAYVNTALLGIRASGRTALRHRQLQQCQYRVIPLPFYQWAQLAGPEERRVFLRRLFLDNLQRRGSGGGGAN